MKNWEFGGFNLDWLEVSIEVPSEFVEPLSNIFFRYGFKGVSIETINESSKNISETSNLFSTKLTTYLLKDRSLDEKYGYIDISVKLISQLGNIGEIQTKDIKNQDWDEIWKKHFPLLKIGKNSVIVPNWIEYEPLDEEVVIRLEPGMAFGTGHHPTTKGCIEFLEDIVNTGDRIIDIGCGSAVLLILGCLNGASDSVGIDIDQFAVKGAKSNIDINNLSDTISIYENSIENFNSQDSFEICVVNVSAEIVVDNLDFVENLLTKDGSLIVSGFMKNKLDFVRDKIRSSRFKIIEEKNLEGWMTLLLSKDNS